MQLTSLCPFNSALLTRTDLYYNTDWFLYNGLLWKFTHLAFLKISLFLTNNSHCKWNPTESNARLSPLGLSSKAISRPLRGSLKHWHQGEEYYTIHIHILSSRGIASLVLAAAATTPFAGLGERKGRGHFLACCFPRHQSCQGCCLLPAGAHCAEHPG